MISNRVDGCGRFGCCGRGADGCGCVFWFENHWSNFRFVHLVLFVWFARGPACWRQIFQGDFLDRKFSWRDDILPEVFRRDFRCQSLSLLQLKGIGILDVRNRTTWQDWSVLFPINGFINFKFIFTKIYSMVDVGLDQILKKGTIDLDLMDLVRYPLFTWWNSGSFNFCRYSSDDNWILWAAAWAFGNRWCGYPPGGPPGCAIWCLLVLGFGGAMVAIVGGLILCLLVKNGTCFLPTGTLGSPITGWLVICNGALLGGRGRFNNGGGGGRFIMLGLCRKSICSSSGCGPITGLLSGACSTTSGSYSRNSCSGYASLDSSWIRSSKSSSNWSSSGA